MWPSHRWCLPRDEIQCVCKQESVPDASQCWTMELSWLTGRTRLAALLSVEAEQNHASLGKLVPKKREVEEHPRLHKSNVSSKAASQMPSLAPWDGVERGSRSVIYVELSPQGWKYQKWEDESPGSYLTGLVRKWNKVGNLNSARLSSSICSVTDEKLGVSLILVLPMP